MLVIRQAQLDVLASAREPGFQRELLHHLRGNFPEETAAFSDAELRRLIASTVDAAEAYGITSRRGVCCFLNFVIVFDEDFASNPDLVWAEEILRGPGSEEERVDRLCERTLEQLGPPKVQYFLDDE